jgi:hypothetical protein
MFEVLSIETQDPDGVTAVTVRAAGSAYVFELVNLLIQAASADMKQAAKAIAEKTGVRITDDRLDLNGQVEAARQQRDAMGDRLGREHARLRLLADQL